MTNLGLVLLACRGRGGVELLVVSCRSGFLSEPGAGVKFMAAPPGLQVGLSGILGFGGGGAREAWGWLSTVSELAKKTSFDRDMEMADATAEMACKLADVE